MDTLATMEYGAGHPAFYRLPAEVLDMIADAYCKISSYGYVDGQLELTPGLTTAQLQLISRDFTQLPSINRRLFRKISLVASPEQIARLQSAPYELLHATQRR